MLRSGFGLWSWSVVVCWRVVVVVDVGGGTIHPCIHPCHHHHPNLATSTHP
jgi:hypothetical protein